MNPRRLAALHRDLARIYGRAGAMSGGGDALDCVHWMMSARAGLEHGARRHVYIVTPLSSDLGLVKIGTTTGRTQARLKAMQTGSPVLLACAFTFPDDRGDLEQLMHRRFAKWRRHGEWFRVEGDVAVFLGRCARQFSFAPGEAV